MLIMAEPELALAEARMLVMMSVGWEMLVLRDCSRKLSRLIVPEKEDLFIPGTQYA